MKRSRTVHLLAALLALSACVGGQTGEPPAEPQRSSHAELDAGCRPPDCPAPTPSGLDVFAGLGGSARDIPPDGGLDELVSISDVVLLGELTGVAEGRKEYRGPAYPCSVADVNDIVDRGDAGPGACAGDAAAPAPPLYTSRVNLLVQPISIFSGELERDAQVAIEFYWPNNAPLDDLIAAAPRGVRLLMFGNRVRDAEERARPLEEAGFAIGTIAPNLFRVREFGLGFENSDGFVDEEAFDGDAFIRLVTNSSPRDMPRLPFQTAIEAVMASASKL